MRMLILLIGLTFSGIVSGQKLKKQKLAEGNVIVKLPETFIEMTPEDIAVRFPSVRKPIIAFTGPQRIMSFNIAVSATQWNKNDYAVAKEFFRSSILNLFDKVDMINEGVTDINKKTFAFFEFESTVRGTQTKPTERTYNFVMYHIVKGKTIVVSFICPRQMKDDWQEPVKQMMQSLKLGSDL